MIQRIQTVFMLLAALCLAAFFYFEIIVFTSGAEQVRFDLCFLRSTDPSRILPEPAFILVAPYIVVALFLMILVNIFLYKKRRTQIMVGNLIIFGLLGLLTFMLLTPDQLTEKLGGDWDQSVKIGYYLPILAIVFMILAMRSIKKDEELVRSTERLR
jgi:hypothetical protein